MDIKYLWVIRERKAQIAQYMYIYKTMKETIKSTINKKWRGMNNI